MERLWRLRDIARVFDVSYTTLWRWSQTGHMKVVRLPGGALRVRDSEIRRILAGEREAVPA